MRIKLDEPINFDDEDRYYCRDGILSCFFCANAHNFEQIGAACPCACHQPYRADDALMQDIFIEAGADGSDEPEEE